ncbi:hypothetical protein PsorP6_002343 [Peronosclerospora sorghi]|uniref:Uncharacterized protein n=1 Tax=Peronosclerospora sorghi TaxID=230839 RepID=A0ACC0WRB0_9STRA|nr:hypothetical protein PsorP6_002343 [Peronosclerospora sorghi]
MHSDLLDDMDNVSMTDTWCLCNEGDVDLTLCGRGRSRDDKAELPAALLVVTGGQLSRGCTSAPSRSAHGRPRALDRHGTEAHFIHMMGIPRRAFERLLAAFVPHYAIGIGEGRSGRPTRLAGHRSALAVPLQFYASNSDTKHLFSSSGCPPTTLLRMLRRAEESVEVALSPLTDAEIRWPSEGEIALGVVDRRARADCTAEVRIHRRQKLPRSGVFAVDESELPLYNRLELHPHAKRPVQWMVTLRPCHWNYCLWRGRVHHLDEAQLPGLMERWRNEPGVP